MKVSVKVLGLTKSEVHLGHQTVVFFSYSTPVAAVHKGVYYQTNKSYSVTTSKHVSQWRSPHHKEVRSVPEEFLAGLLPAAVMEDQTEDVIAALKVLQSALTPHMGVLPDLVMQSITKALNLIAVTETEKEEE